MDISKINTINKSLNEGNQRQEYFLDFQNFDFRKNLATLSTKKFLHPNQDTDYQQGQLIIKK